MRRYLLLIATLFKAETAVAQGQPTPQTPCLKTIPTSDLRRVPVYLQATTDSAVRAVLPFADLFAQSVALRIRELLSSDQSKLPEADSAVLWSATWGEMIITAHRNAPPSVQMPEWSREADTIPRSALSLLRRAVGDVVANGESVIVPEPLTGDSVSFRLSFVRPIVTLAGKVIPINARQPIPVFTIRVAWEKPVAVTKEPSIDYPRVSPFQSYRANVRVVYAVDTLGRADMRVFQDVWPRELKRPTGPTLRAYEAIITAIKEGLPSARFSPASIGGCIVKQRIEQTFEFKIR